MEQQNAAAAATNQDEATASASPPTTQADQATIDPHTLINKTEAETAHDRQDAQLGDKQHEPIAATKEDSTAAIATGFSPFRLWANKKIRQGARRVTLIYAGIEHKVTEITPAGELRLEHDGEARLIPFDERVIPTVLVQLL